MILDQSNTYSIGFTHKIGNAGDIASITIEPTAEMTILRREARTLYSRARNAESAAYEIGYEIAVKQFREKNPDLV